MGYFSESSTIFLVSLDLESEKELGFYYKFTITGVMKLLSNQSIWTFLAECWLKDKIEIYISER